MVSSPPYWNILNKNPDHKVIQLRVKNGLDTNYSNDRNDLANIKSYKDFLTELNKIFKEGFRVLKNGSYMALVVGDFRHKSKYVPFHSDVIENMIDPSINKSGFKFDLYGIIILVQKSKRLYPYGYPYAFVPNIHHQYILIFRKPLTK